MTEAKRIHGEEVAESSTDDAIALVEEIVERFGLGDLRPLLNSVRRHRAKEELNVAVFGRFKAGKSSFLNHLFRNPLLPTDVLPATSVITEIAYGTRNYAELIRLENGPREEIPLDDIRLYVTEAENPNNAKRIAAVRVYSPSLGDYRGLVFVDTPGLESIFEGSTQASLTWSPNVDVALVAVSVDPPLTRQDLSLMERLHSFTSNVTVLLTKVDTLEEAERWKVEEFIRMQLQNHFGVRVRVLPYSIKAGYENLREDFERGYLLQVLTSFQEQRRLSLSRKLQTLLAEGEDYLRLSLSLAEKEAAEREELRGFILGTEQTLRDRKQQLQLVAKHAAGRTRQEFQGHLERTALHKIRKKILSGLENELPGWNGSFAKMLLAFERWLRTELAGEMIALSSAERHIFEDPLRETQRHCQRILQEFRDQLSEKVERVIGFPLHTTEMEIEVEPPRSPDVSVGKVFDHNWELISALIPMPLVRRFVVQRLRARVEYETFKNLCRLASQWEYAIHLAIRKCELDAEKRLSDLIGTVRHLILTVRPVAKAELESYLRNLGLTSAKISDKAPS